MKNIYKILIAFILITTIAFGITQSTIAKAKLNDYVLKLAHKKGLLLNIKKISGSLPFFFSLEDVEFPIMTGEMIHIDKLSFKVSLLPLIQKKLYLNELTAINVTLVKSPQPTPNAIEEAKLLSKDTTKNILQSDFTLPCTIYLNNFKIDNFTFAKDIAFNFVGDIKVDKNIENIFLYVKVTKKDFSSSYLKIASLGSKKENIIRTKWELKAQNFQLFSPFFEPKTNGTIVLKSMMKGSWESHQALFFSLPNKLPPISGTLNGSIFDLKNLPINLDKEINFSTSFSLDTDMTLAFKQMLLETDNMAFDGSINFSNKWQLQNASLYLTLNELSFFSPLLPKGKIKAQLNLTTPNVNITLSSPLIQHKSMLFSNITGIINANIDTLSGHAELNGKRANQFLLAKGDFALLDNALKLSNTTIQSSLNTAKINLSIDKNMLLNGDATLDILATDSIYAFAKQDNFPLKAKKIKANLHLQPDNNKQKLSLNLNGEDVSFYNIHGDTINVNASMDDAFKSFEGNFTFTLKDAHLYTLKINDITVTTNTYQENWPFNATMEGTFQKPIKLTTKGFWNIKDLNVLINIQSIEGYALDKPLYATQPIQLEWAKDKFLLKDLDIALNSSSAQANISIFNNNADIRFILNHFPLEFFSLNPENILFHGTASMQAYLIKKEKIVDGNIDLKIERALISAPLAPPVNGELTLKAIMQNNVLLMQSSLISQNNKLMEMDAAIPLNINFFPFSLNIPLESQIKANLFFNGNIENLLGFIDIKSHYAEGNLKCNLNISNTIKDPKVRGSLVLENGYYENYFSGTSLDNINAICLGEENHLSLKKFTADDDSGGSLNATGYIDITLKDLFPFSINAQFSNFAWLQKDWITAKAQGSVKFTGNMKKAKSEGNITILNTNMSIPSSPEASVFEASVIYVTGELKPQIITTETNPYPIDVDMQVSAPNKIFIKGKGIESEWQGNLKLSGSFANLIAEGSLQLMHGKFSFAGRHFDLIKGAVMFDKKNAEPQIHVVGEMKIQNVTLIANVKGSLTGPEITFTSNPPLPISSIISMLLFGKEAAEISGTQAEQIMAAINTINQNQPASKETTRKSLGIDRFSIATSAVKNIEEINKVAIQVGQYLINGLLITVSQGTEQDISTIIVEVDLLHGFVLQLESQPDIAQGKFVLKWKHNY
jgi:autotransporter translocation and assembly factor TamB